jgi:hypothetical protein
MIAMRREKTPARCRRYHIVLEVKWSRIILRNYFAEEISSTIA